MPRSVTDMRLPEVEEIVEQDAEMRQMLVDISRRQAGGDGARCTAGGCTTTQRNASAAWLIESWWSL